MTKHSILAAAATALILGLAACDTATTSNETGNAAVAQSDADGLSKLGAIRMDVDTSYLSAEEREVVNLLIQAADLMSEIYKRQTTPDYDKLRAEVAAKNDPALLERFDAFFGPWDPIDEDKPFFGGKPKPAGAGFYPGRPDQGAVRRISRRRIPTEAEALTSPYTVVKRQGDKLVAVPYSQEYKQWLEPAAKLLEQAAAKTSNAEPEEIPDACARKAFRTDDYFESELAWMDLKDTPIEVAIGPYETYTDDALRPEDRVRGVRHAAQPEGVGQALDVYKGHLRGMEANLPVEEQLQEFPARVRIADRRSPTRSTAAATMCRASRRSPSTCPTTSGCARPRAPRRSSCATCSAPNTSAS